MEHWVVVVMIVHGSHSEVSRAAGTVTGSKFLFSNDAGRVLIDAVVYQGLRELRRPNWDRLPIEATSLDAVVLTHAGTVALRGYTPVWLFRAPQTQGGIDPRAAFAYPPFASGSP